MSEFSRDRLEQWVDKEGWSISSRRVEETKEAVFGLAFALGIIFVVSTVIIALLEVDPFSSWTYTEDDAILPWFEEYVAGYIALGLALVMSSYHFMVRKPRRMGDVTNSLKCTNQLRAVNTYKKLAEDERKRLKQPLVDYLEMKDSSDDPVSEKHRRAWQSLKQELETREKLLAETHALTAGNEVLDYTESVKSEVQMLRKERELL